MTQRQFHILLLIVFVGITLAGLINVLVLDYLVYQHSIAHTVTALPSRIGSVSSSSPTQSFGSASDECGDTCQKEIQEQVAAATASLTTAITELQNKPAPTSSVSTTTQTIVQSVSAVKEYFIPLGAGSSSAGDWTDVAGVQAYVDTTQYSKIKSVTFEVTLRTPTGNQTAYARLFNATDNHPVWSSDVSIEGGISQLKISPGILLDAGNKLYKVQMKTQLKYPTYVDQSRIHITLN